MKIKVKSWEDIKKALDNSQYTEYSYFPSRFSSLVCGKVFEAVPSLLSSYALTIKVGDPNNEVESFHLHPDWYDVVEEDEPKKPSNLNKEGAVKGTMEEIKTTLPYITQAGLPNPTETLRICGQDVELRYEDPGLWSENSLGLSSTRKGRILLSSNCPEEVQKSTLVHEVTHYILDSLAIPMDEQGVSSFAVSLHNFIQDNPDKINKLMSRK